MPRKTSQAELSDLFTRFIEEAKSDIMKDVMATRVITRRAELLSQADGLDAVSKRFYAWLNGRFAA